MESIRMPYKNDDFGNPVYARISWASQPPSKSPRPIALIYHGGGLIVGSSEIIPRSQIEYLTSANFVVVAPNYRLCPQVPASTAIANCMEAYDWAVNALPNFMQTHHSIPLETKKVVAGGHSTGGTLALLLAAARKPLTAVTAFYPTLYASDETTTVHQPCSTPPFSDMPDFSPTDSDWDSIAPSNVQLSEAGLAPPGTIPLPRNRWQAHLLKNGQWMQTLCPNGEYRVLDPLASLHARNDTNEWSSAAVCIVQGDEDRIPGSGIDLARRAERDLLSTGVEEVALLTVKGANHMFDMALTSDSAPGSGWEDVIQGLEWLRRHV